MSVTSVLCDRASFTARGQRTLKACVKLEQQGWKGQSIEQKSSLGSVLSSTKCSEELNNHFFFNECENV